MYNKAIHFAKALNVDFPAIIQAPMAGNITTPGLVAAVANEHSLGSLATGYLNPTTIQDDIRAIQALTDRPFAVNLFIPEQLIDWDKDKIREYQQHLNPYRQELGLSTENIDDIPEIYTQPFEEIIELLTQSAIKIVSFTFGLLEKKYIERLKNKNIYLIGTATTVEEAQALAESNIDAIVAQGWNAGGHRGSFLASAIPQLETLDLVKNICAVVKTPVIAAGGIMQASDIVAALQAGAVAVQMGTAFLPLTESGAHPTYKAALLDAEQAQQANPTTVTRSYSGKLARSLWTRFIRETLSDNKIPVYPIPYYLARNLRKEAAKQNNPDLMALWCGDAIHRLNPNYTTVAELLHDLKTQTLALIHKET